MLTGKVQVVQIEINGEMYRTIKKVKPQVGDLVVTADDFKFERDTLSLNIIVRKVINRWDNDFGFDREGEFYTSYFDEEAYVLIKE
jgi:hypothetical protein